MDDLLGMWLQRACGGFHSTKGGFLHAGTPCLANAHFMQCLLLKGKCKCMVSHLTTCTKHLRLCHCFSSVVPLPPFFVAYFARMNGPTYTFSAMSTVYFYQWRGIFQLPTTSHFMCDVPTFRDAAS